MTQGFIKQTAHDYDVPIHEVERIAELFPNEFYAKLEEYISDRTKKSFNEQEQKHQVKSPKKRND